MTDRTMTSAELLAATEAAALHLAKTFGLGDETSTIDDWPIDGDDTVLQMELTITGSTDGTSGSLQLAVGNAVATQLLTDMSLLGSGFDKARELLATKLGIALTGAEVVAATTETPATRVAIVDAGQMTALVGFIAPAAAAPVEEPQDSGTEDFATPVERAVSDRPTSRGTSPLSVLDDVQLTVTAELGRTTIFVRDFLELLPGMVVEIDRAAGAPIDLLVNGCRIASGEVVVIDEEFGIRITEIASA